MIQIRTQKHVAYFKSYLLADCTCYLIIITCQNLCRYAVCFQCPDRICSRFLRWIKKCQISDQYHLTLIFYTKCTHRRRIAFLCNGKHTESFVIQFVYCFQNTPTNLFCKWLHSTIALSKRTDGEHFFYSSLCYHLCLSLFILYYRSQTTTCKIKWNLIYLHIIFRQIEELWICRLFFLCSVNDRQIHQVLITGLEVAV